MVLGLTIRAVALNDAASDMQYCLLCSLCDQDLQAFSRPRGDIGPMFRSRMEHVRGGQMANTRETD